MQHAAVSATTRDPHSSKGEVNRLRKSGLVLASIYGKGMKSIPVTLESRDLLRAFSTSGGENTLIDLSLGEGRYLCKLIDMEIDPITRKILHIGLHKIQAGETGKAVISVEIIGEPEAVTNKTGELQLGPLTIEVKALPEETASSIPLDISKMQIGDAFHASDLVLPKGHELLSSPEAPIASLRAIRGLVLPEDAEKATTEEPDTDKAA